LKLRFIFPYLPSAAALSKPCPFPFQAAEPTARTLSASSTRFPFGFLQKAHRVDLRTEALVYPSVEPTREFFEILRGLQGAMESLAKGRGQDLFTPCAITYPPIALAMSTGKRRTSRSLMVREFTREDETRILLVLDPHTFSAASDEAPRAAADRFERAITLCAGIAWHFFERNAQLQFRSAGTETPLAPAEQTIFTILRHLAMAQPLPPT